MQIRDTTNCTQCLGACPTCSNEDPNICTSCPDGQYLAGGICSLCASTCKTCSSGTGCLSCYKGYQLISSGCYAVPSGCVSLATPTTCSICFAGYLLTTGNTACAVDTSCNGTSTCSICDNGYYLSAKKCLNCPTLPPNCLTCDPSLTTFCYICSTGYYVSSGSCVACSTGCADCSSSNFCLKAATGYFLIPDAKKDNSGRVKACQSPCVTCTSNDRLCLTCISGYALNGTKCISNSRINLALVLIGSGSAPITTTGTSS